MPQPIPGHNRRRTCGYTRSIYFAKLEPILTIRPREICHAPTQKHLPVEVINEIFAYITDRRTIQSILQASKRLHAIMLPRIWKDISVAPRVGGEVFGTFEGQLSKECSPWTSRGEQVVQLSLSLGKPRKMEDVHGVYLSVYHLLQKLPNLVSLRLCIGRRGDYLDFEASERWKRGDVDMAKQLPSLRRLAFSPPGIYKNNCKSHPNTLFERWLFSQHSLEHLEYSTQCQLAHKFPPKAFPNLRHLKISSHNIKMTRGLDAPRGITHLKLVDISLHLSRLPPALSNVKVFAGDDSFFELAVLFPKLERIDIDYERNLDWFIHSLRYDGRSRKGNLQNVRLFKVDGFTVSGKEDCKVADVFDELAGLESFEVMRDDLTSIRYARDGTTRAVRWKCDKSEIWYHDWEDGVMTVDPDSPLIFFEESSTIPVLRLV
ncbi:hypothetical protein EYR38_008299 [Pleurotus pulmonarius]|nr:hypothetical protein EYR38_008299 [Pleurotus pulmonarius]